MRMAVAPHVLASCSAGIAAKTGAASAQLSGKALAGPALGVLEGSLPVPGVPPRILGLRLR